MPNFNGYQLTANLASSTFLPILSLDDFEAHSGHRTFSFINILACISKQ